MKMSIGDELRASVPSTPMGNKKSAFTPLRMLKYFRDGKPYYEKVMFLRDHRINNKSVKSLVI